MSKPRWKTFVCGCLQRKIFSSVLYLRIILPISVFSGNYGIIDPMDISLSKLQEIVKNRKPRRAAVHGVAKSQTRLSNGTIRLWPARWCLSVQLTQLQIWPWNKRRILLLFKLVNNFLFLKESKIERWGRWRFEKSKSWRVGVALEDPCISTKPSAGSPAEVLFTLFLASVLGSGSSLLCYFGAGNYWPITQAYNK